MLLCREHLKAEPAVVLVKNFPETGPQVKFSSDRLVELGIKLGTPGYKASDLFTTPRRLLKMFLDVPWK